ncbi:AAA family ATPase [Galbibacter pacificus]|uniref:MoxR family ATPase n=1 Tax=Galbibacter pacificus TaxID=2996052 RepID=A0ABT6FRL0_9FLAO|nr:MoxR family ATPase [Galbibacter pacificus]MDG3581661.1 MoxR family ATPase [Galbibacter pacificus]MDG3585865.1 MoxR family ATPase [Galbibacter pacificus]
MDISMDNQPENQDPQKSSDDLSFQNRVDLSELQQSVDQIKKELGKVIVGQKNMIDMLLTALLANGHVLIEGVPGIAKTITAKLLAKTLTVDFGRIQFTPDLMPSDILGTSIFDLKKSEFEFKKGPVFTNMLLIDEINRAPAKTQAALFEVMEEKQITIDGQRYLLPPPFMVLATQNPIEQEGTYRLPEAQLDRFLFKIDIDYPSLEEEIEIIEREHELKENKKIDKVTPFLSSEAVVKYQKIVNDIIVEPHLIKYIAQLVNNTRNNEFLYMGASPRASIAILKASKAYAAINGRDFVTPEDIKAVALSVIQHRIIITPEKEMEGITAKQIVGQIIQAIEIPR